MHPSIRLLLVATLALASCTDTAPAESPSQTIERLVTSPHGLTRLSDEDQKRLKAVIQEPDRYLPLIEQQYAPAGLDALATDVTAAKRFGVLAGLVGKMHSQKANALLVSWYLRLDDAAAAPAHQPDRQRLAAMRHSALYALGTTKAPEVIERILMRLEQMDAHQRGESLQYLAWTSKQDPAVLERLRTMYESPTSPLHGDPELERTIALIQQR